VFFWKKSKKQRAIQEKEYVLITGASTGIGKATAIRLCNSGFHVIAGVRDEKAAESLTDDTKSKERMHPIFLDVTKDDQIATCTEQIKEIEKKWWKINRCIFKCRNWKHRI